MNPGLHGFGGMPALLRDWLPEQRWFAGKGRGVREVRVVSSAELMGGDPALFHMVVGVRYDDHRPAPPRAGSGAADYGIAGAGSAVPRGAVPECMEEDSARDRPGAADAGPAGAGEPRPADGKAQAARGDAGAAEDEEADGDEYYQLLVGARRLLPPRLTHCALGVLPSDDLAGWTVYDAAHDSELTGWFLDHCAFAPEVEVRFRTTAHGTGDTEPAVKPLAADPSRQEGTTPGGLLFARVPGAQVPTGLVSLVIGVEQSNTSMVFGDQAIMKLFRRLAPGINPDLEVSLALAEAGSDRVAEPLAWMEGRVVGQPTTLAILHRYLTTATDGWELAITSVRDLYAQPDLKPEQAGGDFAGESFRLGVATAEVHADLARTLPSAVMAPEELAALASAMRGRLEDAVASVPRLEPFADGLRDAYNRLSARDEPLPVQRIHGDYHLGQVVRTTGGWVLLDFEGEPARPLGERRSLHSPLRDVAAMLRSFDYAARHLLADHPAGAELEERAREWADRNRDAFCEGYAKASGTDPRDEMTLLRAFETDKAVYEVVYEAHNRPSWLPIPMAAVERLATEP